MSCVEMACIEKDCAEKGCTAAERDEPPVANAATRLRHPAAPSPMKPSRAGWTRLLSPVLATLIVLLAALAGASPASAKRHALVVGISKYDEKSGLERLKAPIHDAKAIKETLEKLKARFETTVLTDADIPDKAAFDVALGQFTDRIGPGDEVLFYFSGHGNFVPGKGNLFLLPNAKNEAAYIKGLSVPEARALDTAERKTEKYQEWLSSVAVHEKDIEEAIAQRKPNVTIVIADACRTSLKGTKGATLDIAGIRMPQHTARGTFRLYSAGVGQFSLDSIEPIFRVEPAQAASATPTPNKTKSDDDKKGSKPTNSLFTKILLSDLATPGLEFTVMAANVRNQVRRHADKLGHVQIPDYSGAPDNNEFYFSPLDQGDLQEVCTNAGVELERLRLAVAAGSIGRDVLVAKRFELAPCGGVVAAQLELLLRMEAQGALAVQSKTDSGGATPADPNDPSQLCEVRASSPFDPNRTMGLPTDLLQQLSLSALSDEGNAAEIKAKLVSIKDTCEQALQERPKVARFSYLTGRVYQTLASISGGLDQLQALASASAYFQQAADLGYAAAFNDLALLHKAGDYYAVTNGSATRLPPDRAKALELLRRGASLNHVVAQYNLGMAHLNGDLSIDLSGSTGVDSIHFRKAEAFRYLSQAAERGFVPALIETAKLLHDGKGITANPPRAIELLEIAASRGSWEAMYWIGFIYHRGYGYDPARAVVWYARAAESGDARAQQQLATMLTDGTGLPAPQREAAGRYWRLAADAGLRRAQFELAMRIKKGEIPFRPVMDGPPDGGALEIRTLLSSAFLRHDPQAGLELGRLFRTGFPVDRPSRAIPKSNEAAALMFWRTIDAVRTAEPNSVEADPKTEVWAAFELMKIYDEEVAANSGLSRSISQDQINQLRADYGDGSQYMHIRAEAIGTLNCGEPRDEIRNRLGNDSWVLVWNWKRSEPPTQKQFDWLERRYKCRELELKIAEDANKKPPADDVIGFTKKTREKVAELQKSALSETGKVGAKAKTFVDRMVELVEGKPKK